MGRYTKGSMHITILVTVVIFSVLTMADELDMKKERSSREQREQKAHADTVRPSAHKVIGSKAERVAKFVTGADYNTLMEVSECSNTPFMRILYSSLVVSENLGSYPSGQLCFYRIAAPFGKVVQIYVIFYQIAEREGCIKDYLAIYDGVGFKTPLTDPLCGEGQDKLFLTSGRHATVFFRSRPNGEQGFGYAFTVTFVDDPAAKNFTDPSAIIAYPPTRPSTVYDDSIRAIWWQIVRDPPQRIRLRFVVLDFGLEEQDVDGGDGDRLIVTDVTDDIERHRWTFKESSDLFIINDEMKSLASTILLEFAANGDGISGLGFVVVYDTFDGEYNPACFATHDKPLPLFGSGYIAIPFDGSSNYYDSFSHCFWEITADPGQHLRITVYGHIEGDGENCLNDHLYIGHNSSETNDQEVAHILCGSINQVLYFRNEQVQMTFYSDEYGTSSGVFISFESAEPTISACSNEEPDKLTANSTVSRLSMPGDLGDNYLDNQDCYWIITAEDPTMNIHISFELFDIEYQSLCLFDRLTIDVVSDEDDLLETYTLCGDDLPAPILLPTGSAAHLNFHSDSSITYRGFLLSYISLELDTIDAFGPYRPKPLGEPPGEIFFPGGSQQLYDHNLDGSWKIDTFDPNVYVRLRFTRLDIEEGPDGDCPYDYVMTSADEHRRLCGYILPPEILVNRHVAVVKFHSDVSVARYGFTLTYETFQLEDLSPDACDPALWPSELTGQESGEFVFPSTSHGYSANMNCSWDIVVPGGPYLQLDIFTQDVEYTAGCLYDYVWVLDPVTGETRRFCGTVMETVLISSDQVSVGFISDGTFQGGGFSLAFKQLGDVPTGDPCSAESRPQVNMAPSGSINFPMTQLSTRNLFCVWRIYTPSNKMVTLTITSMNIMPSTHCALARLLIRHGTNNIFCGYSVPAPYTFVSTSDYVDILFTSEPSASESSVFTLDYVIADSNETDEYEYDVLSTSTDYPQYEVAGDPCNPDDSHIIIDDHGEVAFLRESYPNNIECTWNIHSETRGKFFELHIAEMEIEWDWNCDFDKLTITWSGGNLDLCGDGLQRPGLPTTNWPFIFNITDDMFTIHFKADNSRAFPGFIATWTTIQPWEMSAQCGIRGIGNNGMQAVYGGEEAVANSWPWMVLLKEYSTFICGASIIDPYWVLTAAHCVDSYYSPSFYQLVFGEHNRYYDDGTEVYRDVDLIVRNPYYSNYAYDNDIALMRLSSPIEFDASLFPVCRDEAVPPPGTTCYVTGWGYTEFGYPPSNLREARVSIIDDERCANWLRITENMICAGYEQGRNDTCTGDSGGPLVCPSPENPNRWVQVGITSWGLGCGEYQRPGVYARVSQYLSWIDETLALNDPSILNDEVSH